MIVQLFVFALFFIIFGLIAFFRKKKLIGLVFILLAFMVFVLGLMVVYLYPQSWPF